MFPQETNSALFSVFVMQKWLTGKQMVAERKLEEPGICLSNTQEVVLSSGLYCSHSVGRTVISASDIVGLPRQPIKESF